jgi:hypothetical protein
MTPGWWQWMEAVEQHAPTEGAYVTALVWARRCWLWAANVPDRERARPAHLLELIELHPAAMKERAVRYRMKALQEAGLLVRVKGHSRWSPDIYAPAMPGSSGTQVPVLAINSGSQVPVLPHNSGSNVPVLAFNSGTLTTQQRHLDDAPPLPTEKSEPPSRTSAHTREGNDAVGGEVLGDLLRAMDRRYGETSSRVAPGYRRQAEHALGKLRAAGWPADLLIDRINAREWGTAGSPGRVLMARITDLTHEPPPKTAAQRQAERQAADDRTPCDHGDPKGCAGCFLCRRGSPDDDDVVCQQCHHAAGGNTQPTHHGGHA